MTVKDLLREWRDDPIQFVIDTFNPKKIEPEQAEILKAIATNKRVVIKAGHGIGKTAAMSWAIFWFLFTRPQARIVCTAPTAHQLSDILWAEIAKWQTMSPLLVKFAEWTKTRLAVKESAETWFAVPISTNKPDNMSGWHADNLLVIADEAPGVPEEMFAPIEGSLTGTDNRFVMIGNPTKTSGTFYNAFNRDRSLYKCLTFNSENSALVSKDYIDKMARYGKDSDIYKVRVLGEFPSGEPDTLIQLWMVDQAQGRQLPDEGKVFIGVDPARFGNDESVIFWRRGNKSGEIRTFHGIDTQRQAGEVRKLAREIWGAGYIGTIEVRVDDTGVGGGVTDALQGTPGLLICPINFGGKARNEDYVNFGAEMYGNIKGLLVDISLPKDDELSAQLTSRKYSLDKDGRICLERKEDMKKRGLPSPDRADAIVLAFASVRSDPFAQADEMLTGHRETYQGEKRGNDRFDAVTLESGQGRLGEN